jgi:resuscitation-promoting factor RpfB
VVVDGQRRDLASRARTVSEALAEAKVGLAEFDVVEPALTTQLTGVPVEIRVTRAIPTTVIDGGVVVASRGAAPATDGALLASLGVPLEAADTVRTTLSGDFVGTGVLGQVVTITRGVATVTEEVPAPVQTKNDATLAKGQSKVQKPGEDGQKQVTFTWVYRPGKGYVRGVISETVLKAPVAQVVVQGTKTEPQANRGVRVAGTDDFARLRQCEAGGDYTRNSGNGYYGAYQFDIGTWNRFGGYARADLAPPDVQDQKARDTQGRRGWSPWPACARKLGLM